MLTRILHIGKGAFLPLTAVIGNLVLCAMLLAPAQVSRSENTPAGVATAPRASGTSRPVTPLESGDMAAVRQFATEYGVDYLLVLAIIRQESRFDPEAVSERGASGMMQIMPVTNAEISEQLEILDPSHPRENLRAGIYYFAKLSRLFRDASPLDRASLALAAYNAGPNAAARWRRAARARAARPQRNTHAPHPRSARPATCTPRD